MLVDECAAALVAAVGDQFAVEVILGKKNVEVRPRACNKGKVVQRLLELHPDVDFVFCAGDDQTDEDMFRVYVVRSGTDALSQSQPGMVP